MQSSPRRRSDFDGLVQRLDQGRLRAVRQRALRGALRSAQIGALAFATLALVRLLLGLVPGTPPVSLGWMLGLSATVMLLALVATAVALRRTAPTTLEVARRAETRYGLEERLSTALEAPGAGAAGTLTGTVAGMLRRDAGRYADVVEPRDLAPRLPWRGLRLLVLTGALGAALLLVPVPVTAPLGPPEQAGFLEGQEPSEAAVKVRRVAELLARDAEQRGDPYLQVLADAFNALGRELEREGLDRAAVESELDRLAAHLENAYADLDADLAGLLRSADADAAAAPPGDDPAAFGLAPEAADAPADRQPARSSGLDELLARLEDRGAAPIEGAAREASAPSDSAPLAEVTTRDHERVSPEQQQRVERERMALERQRSAMGQPIGAAQEAQKGASVLAGEGSPTLEDGVESPDLGFAAAGEELELPSSPGEEGSRIRLEVAPETRLSEVSDAQVGVGAWTPGREAPIAREPLDPSNQAVVERYFFRAAEADDP